MEHADIVDISTPDLIGMVNDQIPQEVWLALVSWMGMA
jgi:hypothetical protein